MQCISTKANDAKMLTACCKIVPPLERKDCMFAILQDALQVEVQFVAQFF